MSGRTKVQLTVVAMVFIGVLAALTVQDHSRQKLEATEQCFLHDLATLQSTNLELSNQLTHVDSLESTTIAESNELFQLRAEITVLINAIRDLPARQRQNQELLSRLPAPALTITNALPPADQFILQKQHIMNATEVLLKAVEEYCDAHDSRAPGSFADLADMLPGPEILTNNLFLADFEWLPENTLNHRGGRLLFRNRVPIPQPGDDPIWIYASFDNGRRSEITTAEDFTGPQGSSSQ